MPRSRSFLSVAELTQITSGGASLFTSPPAHSMLIALRADVHVTLATTASTVTMRSMYLENWSTSSARIGLSADNAALVVGATATRASTTTVASELAPAKVSRAPAGVLSSRARPGGSTMWM